MADATHPDVVVKALAAVEKVAQLEQDLPVGRPWSKEQMAVARCIRSAEIAALKNPECVGQFTLNPLVFNPDGTLVYGSLPRYGPYSPQLLIHRDLPEGAVPAALGAAADGAAAEGADRLREMSSIFAQSVHLLNYRKHGIAEEKEEVDDGQPEEQEDGEEVGDKGEKNTLDDQNGNVERKESEQENQGEDSNGQEDDDVKEPDDIVDEETKVDEGTATEGAKIPVELCWLPRLGERNPPLRVQSKAMVSLSQLLRPVLETFQRDVAKKPDSVFGWCYNLTMDIKPEETLQSYGFKEGDHPTFYGRIRSAEESATATTAGSPKMTVTLHWAPKRGQATTGNCQQIKVSKKISMTTPFGAIFDEFFKEYVKNPILGSPLVWACENAQVKHMDTPAKLNLTVDSHPLIHGVLVVRKKRNPPRNGHTVASISEEVESKALSKKKAPPAPSSAGKKVSFAEAPTKAPAEAPGKARGGKARGGKARGKPPAKAPPKSKKRQPMNDSDDSTVSELSDEDSFDDYKPPTKAEIDSDSERVTTPKNKSSAKRKATPKPDPLFDDDSDSEGMGPSKKKKEKRLAGEYAIRPSQQMNNEVGVKMDATVKPLDILQAMSRPFSRTDFYAPDPEDSDSESVVNQKRWPVVLHGLFCLTEQKANPNGGGPKMGGFRRKPLLSIYTGSKTMSEKMAHVMEEVKAGKVELAINDTYEEHKNALFGDPSIEAPIVNTAKVRKLKQKLKQEEKEAKEMAQLAKKLAKKEAKKEAQKKK